MLCMHVRSEQWKRSLTASIGIWQAENSDHYVYKYVEPHIAVFIFMISPQ